MLKHLLDTVRRPHDLTAPRWIQIPSPLPDWPSRRLNLTVLQAKLDDLAARNPALVEELAVILDALLHGRRWRDCEAPLVDALLDRRPARSD